MYYSLYLSLGLQMQLMAWRRLIVIIIIIIIIFGGGRGGGRGGGGGQNQGIPSQKTYKRLLKQANFREIVNS